MPTEIFASALALTKARIEVCCPVDLSRAVRHGGDGDCAVFTDDGADCLRSPFKLLNDLQRVRRGEFAFGPAQGFLDSERRALFPEIGLIDEFNGEPEAAMPDVVGWLECGDLMAGGRAKGVEAGFGEFFVEEIGGDGGAIGESDLDAVVGSLFE